MWLRLCPIFHHENYWISHTRNQFFGWTCVWWQLRMLGSDTHFWLCQMKKNVESAYGKICCGTRSCSCSFSLFYGRLWIIYFIVNRRVADILGIIAVVIFSKHLYQPSLFSFIFTNQFTFMRRQTTTDCRFISFLINFNWHII